MHISLKTIAYSTIGALLLLSLLSDAPVTHAKPLIRRDNRSRLDKRDVLGDLLPIDGVASSPKNDNPSSPAPAPEPASSSSPPPSPPALAPAPAPAPEKKEPGPASEPATSSPPKSSNGSGLLDEQLGVNPDPPKHETPPTPPTSSSSSSSSSSASSPVTSTEGKKKPSRTTNGSSRTDDDSSSSSGGTMASSGLNGDQDQDPKETNGTNNKGVTAAGVKTEGLSSGIVAMIVLVVLAVVAAVLSSCYRIRQSRERRKQREDCWVGYNNGVTGGTGGGVVGSIDVKSEALGDGGCPMATVEAAYARRGSLGGTSLKDINNVGNGGYGGNYSPYSQHAHVYPQPPQQPYASAYGGNYY